MNAYRASAQEDRSILVVALGGEVCGIDPRSGAWLWRNSLPGAGRGEVALLVHGGVIFAAAPGPVLFALHYPSGRELWRAQTARRGRATLLAEAGQIYVARGGVVDCFSWTGQPLWSQELRAIGVGRAAVGFPDNVAQADDIGDQ